MDCNCTVKMPGPSVATCGGSTVFLFMSILEQFLRRQCDIEDPCGHIDPVLEPEKEYDFIVVGGGTAGSVVANRLSEVPEWRVLVVEAGPNEPTGAQVPSLWPDFQGTSIDWQYRTEPEAGACLGFPDRRCPAPRGKVIGGSSVLNGMYYVRGSKQDFDDWEALGNYNWSYESVLPYFLKSENNLQASELDRKYHNVGGYLPVTQFNWQPPMAADVLKAAQEMGLSVGDINGERHGQFTILQTNTRDGVRYSASRAFLRPVRNRTNLHVMLNTTVARVLVSGTSKQTYGVEVITERGERKEILATKEVIVCAGAINSPQILLLSGVGDEKDMVDYGIPVTHHLPGVGKNLQNHISYAVRFFINETDKNFLNWATAKQYLQYRNGPLSGYFAAAGFYNTRFNNASLDQADVQVIFRGYSATCSKTGDSREPSGNIVPRSIFPRGVLDTKRYVNISTFCLRPKSRGYISLKDNNPLSPPKIVMNYFTDPIDIAKIIEGIKFDIELTKTKSLQKYGFELDTNPVSGCEDKAFGSDEYWECAIRTNTKSGDHQAGSCKMGPTDDPMAVVDPELKVHGVKGLRVADASIMPTVVSGNIFAPTLMIGEKCADMIKRNY